MSDWRSSANRSTTFTSSLDALLSVVRRGTVCIGAGLRVSWGLAEVATRRTAQQRTRFMGRSALQLVVLVAGVLLAPRHDDRDCHSRGCSAAHGAIRPPPDHLL